MKELVSLYVRYHSMTPSYDNSIKLLQNSTYIWRYPYKEAKNPELLKSDHPGPPESWAKMPENGTKYIFRTTKRFFWNGFLEKLRETPGDMTLKYPKKYISDSICKKSPGGRTGISK